jgi:hypothetical protein
MIWRIGDNVEISGYGTATSAARTIWPENSIIPIPNQVLRFSFSSSSANDTEGGSGAQALAISGLGKNFQPVEYVIPLAGQTPIYLEDLLSQEGEKNPDQTTYDIRFINNLEIRGGKNDGIIYAGHGTVIAGVPATIYEVIPAGLNVSHSLRYTVPAGHVFEMENASIETDNNIVDVTIQTCRTNNLETTVVISHGLKNSIRYQFGSGETITLQHLNASVAGVVYGILRGKLKKL